MKKKLDQILIEILGRITPSEEERKKVAALSRALEKKVAASAKKRGIEAKVRVEGSVAKDTWLKEEPDLDVFMCMPTAITRKQLAEVSLEIAREATRGARQVERFAEHPYLEAFVDDFRVNIVPCYCTKRGDWLSATDRTPFHTNYMRERLNKALRDEVRLLKKFMKGIGVYGAEIKIGGFSGYLCELLILNYKSFLATLHAFSESTARIVIDIENHYREKANELRLGFTEPLVVVDPVDNKRNVAAAVKPQKIDTFIAAARAFQERPSAEFFFPPRTVPFSIEALEADLKHHGSATVFLIFKAVEAVPDVLWGQYYRTQRGLRKMLELNDFRVLRDAAYTDEKTLSAFIIELEQQVIPVITRHLGPPIRRKSECHKFLSKYSGQSNVISGPYIENGRWMVDLPRKHVDAAELLRSTLSNGGENAGIADVVVDALGQGFTVKTNGEITEVYMGNEDFAVFLTNFLDGKPFWLKTAKT